MMSLSSYLKYEEKVIDQLKMKLMSESIDENNIRVNFQYKYGGITYDFDLVEFDEEDRLQRIYEIKTFSSVKSNFNFIMTRLQKYKRITEAEVYLVYLDNKQQLQILSLPNVDKEVKRQTSNKKPYHVDSFSDFYKILRKNCGNKDSELHYFFRGHSNEEYEIKPSVYRDGIIKYENRMFHEAIRNNPLQFSEDMSTFDKLVKMQHYGLPTRLLDITTNPLVALFFACKGNDKSNGVVLIFPLLNEQIEYYDSDRVNVLSNLAKLSTDFQITTDKKSLVYDINQDNPNYEENDLEENAIEDVLCVLPKFNNERIIRQQGAFFIFGMDKTKDKPAQFKDNPIRIIIKADCKKEILNELEVLGIDEASLFPETDKILKQIKLNYSNK